MKIILKCPGYSDTVFNSYENLNIIWELIENYNNITLEVVKDDKDTNVNESISSINSNLENTQIEFKYEVPKDIVFTQRFQDRVNHDISSILQSVYPEQFDITYIKFSENRNTMYMLVGVDISKKDTEISLDFLDENIGYIVKDLIDYYIER